MGEILVNPSATEDVEFSTAPTWSGEPGSAAFNWSIDSGLAGVLAIADDKQSAKLVTAAGNFTAHIIVTDPASGVTETATVTRAQGVITAIGLAARVVPKVVQ